MTDEMTDMNRYYTFSSRRTAQLSVSPLPLDSNNMNIQRDNVTLSNVNQGRSRHLSSKLKLELLGVCVCGWVTLPESEAATVILQFQIISDFKMATLVTKGKTLVTEGKTFDLGDQRKILRREELGDKRKELGDQREDLGD